MEKYLIIIILVVLAYYLHRYCIQIEIEKILKTKEGFAGTTGDDADVASSINTLAQIAKDLQAGGLTVPGALNIKSVINTDGNITTKGAINASGGITCNAITSGPITSDTITAKGLVTATNGSKFTGNRHFFQDEENTGRLRVGAAWGIPGIYAQDGQDLVLGAESGTTCIGPPDKINQHLSINGNLTVKGTVIRNNPIYRIHDVAGYIQTEIDGIKAPFYYGVNFGWRDHSVVLNVKRNHNLNDYQLNNSGIDFRSKPTYLTVFPNYKARLYYHDRDKSFSAIQPAFSTGEHANITHNNRFAHIVWVTLFEEQEGPDRINGN